MRGALTVLHTHRGPLLVLCATWVALNAWLQIEALQLRPDGIWAGHLNIWSDWPLHAGMAIGFADRPPELWLAHHPMFAHGALRYPFGVNLVSGLLLRAGLPLDWALTLPTLLAAAITPLLLYALFFHLAAGRRAALIAVFLFYLGAGLGGWDFLVETARAGHWSALAYPPLEVSRLDEYDWYSGNVLTGMLLPQRAFVFGFPFALLALIGLLRGLQGPIAWSVAGGVLAGLLPLLHVHSYIALALIGVAVAATHAGAWRRWGLFALLAGGIGGACIALVYGGGDGLPNHLRWAPGFAADGDWQGWLRMWWRLWGLTLPVVIVAALLMGRDPRIRMAVLAGALCFAFANLVLVQPNRWDNAKIFLWAWLCFMPACALLLRVLAGRWLAGGVLLAPLVALGLTLTGMIEIWRLVHTHEGSYKISSAAELALARQIRRGTAPAAVFATEPSHNHPVMAWAGRPILMGFSGWIANLGFDWREREQALERIYVGGPRARGLLQHYGVDYVYIGPGERRRFSVNEAWYARHFRVAFRSPQARVYAVRPGSG